MKPVGIIANAFSGKDVRRLVAPASVFGDHEKINILKRMLLTLDGAGVERALLMPDPLGLSYRALHDVKPRLERLAADLLPLPYLAGDWRDSLRATQQLVRQACACIITLGGDGTNRVVASASGATPLLPVSAGTNNVFPRLMEATTAGLAAAALAAGAGGAECCRRQPLLELYRNGEYTDLALIDAVAVAQPQAGARAVWDPDDILELCLTRARPAAVGLSAIGGCLHPLPPDSGLGLYLRTGVNGRRVTAPLAPGLLRTISIAEYRTFTPEQDIVLQAGAGMIALDGEREIVMDETDTAAIRLNLAGPPVVDVDATLDAAVANGFLSSSST